MNSIVYIGAVSGKTRKKENQIEDYGFKKRENSGLLLTLFDACCILYII